MLHTCKFRFNLVLPCLVFISSLWFLQITWTTSLLIPKNTRTLRVNLHALCWHTRAHLHAAVSVPGCCVRANETVPSSNTLSFSFSVCVAAALVIVSEVADQANDNLKQGVSLWVRIHPASLHSDCVAPVEFDIFTAHRCSCCVFILRGNERTIFKRDKIRQLRFFSHVNPSSKRLAGVKGSSVPLFLAFSLLIYARGKERWCHQKVPGVYYKGSSVKGEYDPPTSLLSSHVALWLTSCVYHTFFLICAQALTHAHTHRDWQTVVAHLSLGMKGRESERDVILKMWGMADTEKQGWFSSLSSLPSITR